MSDQPKLVKARYVGPFDAFLPDRTALVPGETIVEIPEAEAKESDNWEPVKGSSKKAAD